MKSLNSIADYYSSLTQREKIFVGVGVATLIAIALIYAISSVQEVFRKTHSEIERLTKNYATVQILADRYARLEAKLRNLEKEFRRKGRSGGVRSYLEKALRTVAGLSPGEYSIKPGAIRNLGKNYKQAPFTIRFNSTSLKKVVAFLKDIVQSDSSLLITKLDITKGRRSERLTIIVDVTSVTNAR
ncbi:MAG: hypothetical protein D6808_01965 [Candidatus Dadabacteria bacterium]|nr:MAG: hypothetical protein D6808_01965 [Candidatus Dadabacteria bacterium]